MVHFVGAGSGAPDLITVRGMRLLQKADVIIYAGSLVNPQLLDYAKEGCEIHNSAKMTLEEVISVMEQAEKNVKGNKATFIVQVQYRQNATWQGQVTWSERNVTKHFRSALELIKLIDSATEEAGI